MIRGVERFQWMPQYQALGSNAKKQKSKSLKHTHAFRLHIDHLVSRMCDLLFCLLKQRAEAAFQTNPEKADIHIQQQNIARGFDF